MIQKGNFLLLEKSEFRDWLKKQFVTRPISFLQVHHTAIPNYTTRRVVNGVGQQDIFACLEGMRNSHIGLGWGATGQNITIDECGRVAISLDRNLNRIPAGIRMNNNKSLCIEIIGQFEKGCDKMTEAQKEAVIHVYACLAEKFKLPINTNTIVYHAWFTYSGSRLQDYTPGRSSKSCPGTAFFGGNTVSAAKKEFLPAIQKELNRLVNNIKEEDEPMTAEEKAVFKDLVNKVDQLEHSKDVLKDSLSEQREIIAAQAKEIEALKNKMNLSKVPSYAQEAINKLVNMKDANGKPIVDTPNGRSADFYSIVTVLNRVGLFNKQK